MKQIPLSNIEDFAFIDDADFELVSKYRWRVKCTQWGEYIATSKRIEKRVLTIYLHRLIMQPLPGEDTHHKDGNTFNCQRKNLENIEHNLHMSYKGVKI